MKVITSDLHSHTQMLVKLFPFPVKLPPFHNSSNATLSDEIRYKKQLLNGPLFIFDG